MPPSLLQKAQNLKKSYPSFKDFYTRYSPLRQEEFAVDERETIMADYSPVSVLDAAYAPGCAASWINFALAELNTFAGAKNIDDNQTLSLARIIVREYGDMKISMFQLFFYRFKCGDFGKFYGMVDPMVITCALKDFVADCERKRQEYLNEEYEARQREDREFREDVYRCWNNLFEELLDNIVDKDKEILQSVYIDRLLIDGKCLLICVTKLQYKLLTDDYLQLYISLIKKHFSELRKVDFKYRIYPTSSENIEDKTTNKRQ